MQLKKKKKKKKVVNTINKDLELSESGDKTIF